MESLPPGAEAVKGVRRKPGPQPAGASRVLLPPSFRGGVRRGGPL